MNKALKYDAPSGHICKMNPTEFHEFYMESSEAKEQHFRATLDIETIVMRSKKKMYEHSRHSFVIDITDPTLDQVCAINIFI